MHDDVEILSLARVGHVLDDKWTLERLLGVGGMAAVYDACHRNGARAAVKVLHPHLSRHEEVRERFLREGYAANRVGHPGAVKVLDDDIVSSGPDEGTAYIVMELLLGMSLQERIDEGPRMGEIEFLRIAWSVLDVLRSAHERGVIHRDLKPENLFLVHPQDGDTPGGPPTIKVLDFGLARLLQAQAITTFGLALGTPSFMSPEQASGESDQVDGRTDLFALAATGFRIRTGRRIHEAANALELVQKMAILAAPRIRAISADATSPFARVIDRALEFHREDRYDSAAAMQRDVERAIGQIDAGEGPTQVAMPAAMPEGEDRDPPTLARGMEYVQPKRAVAIWAGFRRLERPIMMGGFFLVVALGTRWIVGSLRSSGAPSLRAGAGFWGAPDAVEEVVNQAPPDSVNENDDASQNAAPPSVDIDSVVEAGVAPTRAPSRPAKGGPAQIHRPPRKRRFLR